MKKTIVLAAACLALGACSHKQTRNDNADVSTASGTTQGQSQDRSQDRSQATTTDTTSNTGTTSGTTSSSLGAVSSGRGH